MAAALSVATLLSVSTPALADPTPRLSTTVPVSRTASTAVEVTAVPTERGIVGNEDAVPVRITVENTGTTTLPAGTVS
ncbi:MAG: hypothetical protein ACTJHU_02435, partial [Mycetocola sp.]